MCYSKNMDIDFMKKLATMARVDMTEAEMIEIGQSFEPILAYVGQIKEVSAANSHDYQEEPDEPINVLRDDIITNEPGQFTDKILAQMPASQDGYLKVKQIL